MTFRDANGDRVRAGGTQGGRAAPEESVGASGRVLERLACKQGTMKQRAHMILELAAAWSGTE